MKTKINIYTIIAACFIIALAITGCAKKSQPKNTTDNNNITPLNLPQKYGQVQVNALNEGKATSDVSFLKSEIEVFYMQKGEYPKSLHELVSSGTISQSQMPKPPKGIQFIYDPKTGNVSYRMKTP